MCIICTKCVKVLSKGRAKGVSCTSSCCMTRSWFLDDVFSWILLRTSFQLSEMSDPSRTDDKTLMFLLLRSPERSTSQSWFTYKLGKERWLGGLQLLPRLFFRTQPIREQDWFSLHSVEGWKVPAGRQQSHSSGSRQVIEGHVELLKGPLLLFLLLQLLSELQRPRVPQTSVKERKVCQALVL